MSGETHTESPRRLVTIVAADIAGYSRLVGMDEEGTIARLKRHRRELIEPTIAEHNGRLIKWMGDGFLAEFASPVEAVRCAVVIQQSMAGRNAALSRPNWIQFRVGVNLGDVIVDQEDVYGDGVNLAARLQALADPGGVYISGGVYELVKNKLVVGYQSLGDRKVKNITDPIRVYRVLPDPAAVAEARHSRLQLIAALIVVVLCSAGAAGAYSWWTATGAMRKPVVAATPSPAPNGSTVITAPPPARAPEPKDERIAAVTPPPKPAPPKAPETVELPGGAFTMGSNDDASERPTHRVSLRPFAIGKYPVTIGEWKQCVAAHACPEIAAAGEDDAPITNVSWSDAQQYAAWLARITGLPYRLPSEAEWEYAARGGTQTKYWWGNEMKPGVAACKGCGEPYDPHHPVKVGSFPANPFGLHDMGGDVAEWVADCWHKDYHGAPADGSAWQGDNCREHVLRGGSWQNDASYLRTTSRDSYDTGVRYLTHGFRVARSL
ncbi:MAG TPA: SUMF1/EgtB/PvdO family nonheme iron enzyme [Stellaceae bacterium]|nr:SUMF1/EgtB/PvdO family nonheme iron enzyme [Stellaceae bacterium]